MKRAAHSTEEVGGERRLMPRAEKISRSRNEVRRLWVRAVNVAKRTGNGLTN